MEVLKGFATAGSVQWFKSTINSDSELSAKKLQHLIERKMEGRSKERRQEERNK